ncbi:MAG: hypothetical protein R2734_14645 [Nocardioides sp.]
MARAAGGDPGVRRAGAARGPGAAGSRSAGCRRRLPRRAGPDDRVERGAGCGAAGRFGRRRGEVADVAVLALSCAASSRTG